MSTTQVKSGTAQPGVVGDIAKADAHAAQVAQELAESKSQVRSVSDDEIEAVKVAQEALKDKTPEIVDSVELQLPNGVIIEMEQPKVATAFALSRIVGNNEGSISIIYLKALMYISRVNGQKVLPLSDMVGAQALANQLGDDGFDIVLTAYSTYWPTVTPDKLPVVKKNLRG